MNFRDIEYILTAADSGSFAQAAKICHVSQPSLSIQIKKIEERLGHKIFIREKKGVRLTAFGVHISDHLQTIHESMESIESLAKTYHQIEKKPLKIGAIATTAPYLFPFLNDLETVSLEEGKTELLLQKLMADDIDAAILALPVKIPLIKTLFLYDEPFYLATSKHGKCKDKNDLEAIKQSDNCRFLILTEEHCMGEQAIDLCKLNMYNKNRVCKFASLETIRQMVAKSDIDVTLMPKMAVREHDGLVYQELPPKYYRSMGLVFKAGNINYERIISTFEILKTSSSHILKSVTLRTL